MILNCGVASSPDRESTFYTDADLGVSAFYRVAQLAAQPLFFEDFESGAKGWDASDLGESGTLWECSDILLCFGVCVLTL